MALPITKAQAYRAADWMKTNFKTKIATATAELQHVGRNKRSALRHLMGAFRKPTDWAWASKRRTKAIAPYALIAEFTVRLPIPSVGSATTA